MVVTAQLSHQTKQSQLQVGRLGVLRSCNDRVLTRLTLDPFSAPFHVVYFGTEEEHGCQQIPNHSTTIETYKIKLENRE